MKLALMQPYFFPYIGYFELIAGTDRWLVFDTVQYNAHTWMNRNRILHPTKGWQYVTVPVVHAAHGTAISDIRIKNRDAALRRLLGQLDHYRKRAPHFDRVTDIVRATFANSSDRLVDLNVAGLSAVCDCLGIAFRYTLCSQEHLDVGADLHGSQWPLHIARRLGATEYVNAPGGRDMFRQSDWDAAGIRLSFTEMPQLAYDCSPYKFVENLSILDVLMWNDIGTVVKALQRPN